MPNRDGGVMGGGRGVGWGVGRGQRRPLGSGTCTCPKCGNQEPHIQRGVPCSQITCPKCGTMMKGEFC